MRRSAWRDSRGSLCSEGVLDLLRLLPNSPLAAGDAVAGRLRFRPAAADGEAVAGRLRGCSRGDRELGLADCGEPAGDRRWADTMSRTLIGYRSAACRIGNRPPSTGAPVQWAILRHSIKRRLNACVAKCLRRCMGGAGGRCRCLAKVLN